MVGASPSSTVTASADELKDRFESGGTLTAEELMVLQEETDLFDDTRPKRDSTQCPDCGRKMKGTICKWCGDETL